MTLNALFQSFIAVVKDELYEHFIRDHRHRDVSIFSLLHSGRKSLNLQVMLSVCEWMWVSLCYCIHFFVSFTERSLSRYFSMCYFNFQSLDWLALMMLPKNIGCRWYSSVFATDGDQWQTPIWHENQWLVGCRTKKTDEYQRQPMFFGNIISAS